VAGIDGIEFRKKRMHFDCPNCQQRLEIENERAGEHLPCPACNQTIRVPMAPLIIHKGKRSGGVRLVTIPPGDRHLRKGSLAARVVALKAAQEVQEVPEDPKLL
jgi:hypothetical protein